MSSSRRETVGYLLLLFLTLIPAWAPLTRPGLPQWLPGALPVLRLYAREQGAAWDVGWVLDSGFAYGAARALRLMGLDGVTAIKASLIVGMMLLGWVTWLWTRRLFGHRAGILAVMLLLYAPVFLSAIYIFGAIAAVWILLGWNLLGLGVSLRGWPRVLMTLVGAVLTAANLTFLFKTPLALTRIPFYKLIEAPWFWETGAVSLHVAPAWTVGLPILALTSMVAWLAFRHRQGGQTVGWLIGSGVLFIIVALFAPGDVALVAILIASSMLAMAAAGLLVWMPMLKAPAPWAALLILPFLAAGPALSPNFQAYPVPERPAGVFGPQQILLIDAHLTAPPAAGQTLVLDTVWQATRPIDFDYNLFIHVIAPDGNLVAQWDGQPLSNRPMTTWVPGEVLTGRYELAIPTDAPTPLRVRLGLYNWQSGQRLRLPDGADAVVLGP